MFYLVLCLFSLYTSEIIRCFVFLHPIYTLSIIPLGSSLLLRMLVQITYFLFIFWDRHIRLWEWVIKVCYYKTICSFNFVKLASCISVQFSLTEILIHILCFVTFLVYFILVQQSLLFWLLFPWNYFFPISFIFHLFASLDLTQYSSTFPHLWTSTCPVLSSCYKGGTPVVYIQPSYTYSLALSMGERRCKVRCKVRLILRTCFQL